MENFKIKLDRPPISSEEINQRKNFNEVLDGVNKAHVSAYKSPWFWGSAGLACLGVATIVTLNSMSNYKKTENDKNITLKDKTELPKDTECVKPPIQGEIIPFETHEVNVNKDNTITLASGTEIKIEKNSLQVNNSSKPVKIEVREIRSMSDAFISGIKMDVEEGAFETVGMLEIVGKQDGKEVAINPEKPIQVNLKTTTDNSGFAFWKLNKKTATWENYPHQKNNPINTNSNASIKAKEQEIKSDKIELKTTNEHIASLQKPKAEEYKIPTKKNQQMDIKFDKKDFPELTNFEGVLFEVASNQIKDEELVSQSKKKWNKVDLIKQKSDYLARFSKTDETYTLPVRPVLQGDDLKKAKASFEESFNNYSEAKKNLENKKLTIEKRIRTNETALANLINAQLNAQDQQFVNRNQKMVDLYAQQVNGLSEEEKEIRKQLTERQRNLNDINMVSSISFSSTQWGIFNCDKPRAYPQEAKRGLAFLWIGGALAKFRQLFVFNKDKNARYSYGDGFGMDIENLGFDKKDEQIIIGIDENGNLGYCEMKNGVPHDEFVKLNFTKKDKEEKTLHLLQKLLNEVSASV